MLRVLIRSALLIEVLLMSTRKINFYGKIRKLSILLIPCTTIEVGYYGVTLVICVSVHMSVFPTPVPTFFQDDNLRKCQRIFTKLGMCIELWRSGLGLLMGKFRQFLTELSA